MKTQAEIQPFYDLYPFYYADRTVNSFSRPFTCKIPGMSSTRTSVMPRSEPCIFNNEYAPKSLLLLIKNLAPGPAHLGYGMAFWRYIFPM
jgi:hypothetical protein